LRKIKEKRDGGCFHKATGSISSEEGVSDKAPEEKRDKERGLL